MAATAPNDVGAQLLQAQLPRGITIPQADCEQIARADYRATLAHRDHALAILRAALFARVKKGNRWIDAPRPCECVRHIYRASLAAAPEQASALLEIVLAFYPDCAELLGSTLGDSTGADISGVNEAGFGTGVGPGFPGTPGFTGSPPSGTIILPTPPPITSVVNG